MGFRPRIDRGRLPPRGHEKGMSVFYQSIESDPFQARSSSAGFWGAKVKFEVRAPAPAVKDEGGTRVSGVPSDRGRRHPCPATRWLIRTDSRRTQ